MVMYNLRWSFAQWRSVSSTDGQGFDPLNDHSYENIFTNYLKVPSYYDMISLLFDLMMIFYYSSRLYLGGNLSWIVSPTRSLTPPHGQGPVWILAVPDSFAATSVDRSGRSRSLRLLFHPGPIFCGVTRCVPPCGLSTPSYLGKRAGCTWKDQDLRCPAPSSLP